MGVPESRSKTKAKGLASNRDVLRTGMESASFLHVISKDEYYSASLVNDEPLSSQRSVVCWKEYMVRCSSEHA